VLYVYACLPVWGGGPSWQVVDGAPALRCTSEHRFSPSGHLWPAFPCRTQMDIQNISFEVDAIKGQYTQNLMRQVRGC
jgi:hypothetical protein